MMISYLKKQIQTKLHPKGDSTNSISTNGSIPQDNFHQFTEESIRKGPLSDFVFKEKYGFPLEQSHFQLDLKQGLKNELAVKYFTHFVQIKGFYNVYKLLRTIESLISTCDTNESENSNKSLGLECDMLEVWNLCKEEESQGRLNIPEGLNKEMSSGGHRLLESDVRILYDALLQSLDVLWMDFTKSECYCKYEVEILTSDNVTLADILFHPTGMSYFMEFLEEENCHTVLEFWLAVTNFERLLRDATNTLEESQNDAITIYDKYLSLQAWCPLGFTDPVRYTTELAICDEAGPRLDCFSAAQAVVRAFLRHQLKLFVSAQHFDRFLSDIIGSARQVSPCSSLSSVVSAESASLMASASSHPGGGAAGHQGHSRGLSFGRIDPLGRFETDVLPEPNKKESAISKVMRRLTSRESKEEEEMAWRVAEKIVRTVTSLTLGGEGGGRGGVVTSLTLGGEGGGRGGVVTSLTLGGEGGGGAGAGGGKRGGGESEEEEES